MSRFWSPFINGLKPYVPGEQCNDADWVKLNTNESPFGPSPRALQAMRDEVQDSLRLYPDPESLLLRRSIAKTHAIGIEEVFVGNGSDEVLGHAFGAFFKQNAPVLFPDVTYNFYTSYCALHQIAYRQIPLDASFAIDIDAYDEPNGGIVFPNPNAPTGRGMSLNDVRALLERHPDKVVLVDEAYVDFGGESAIPLVRHYPNLLVVQTFSKSRGLAGLRVGFAVGQRTLIEALERVKNSFNSYPLSRLAQVGASVAMEDRLHFNEVCAVIQRNRESLSNGLRRMGFEVLPSVANFVFVRHPDYEGAVLAAALRERKILVRHFNQPRISAFLRITIGTDAQCESLLDALALIVR